MINPINGKDKSAATTTAMRLLRLNTSPNPSTMGTNSSALTIATLSALSARNILLNLLTP